MEQDDPITVPPEELGRQMGVSSLIALVIIGLLHLITVLFLLDQAIYFSSIPLSLLASIILTMVLPSLVYMRVSPAIKEFSSEVLHVNTIPERGVEDRKWVFFSSIVSLTGLLLYIGTPYAVQSPNVTPIHAIASPQYSFVEAIAVLYTDLMTVFSLGIFVGFGLIVWFRAFHPRACRRCGNRKCITEEYCASCGTSLDNILTRRENVISLLRDDDEFRKLD